MIAWPNVCFGPSPASGAALPGGSRVASASDNGMHRRMIAEKVNAVGIQPNAPIMPPAKGENRNCPNEPAAVPRPNAIDRRSGGSSFENAPMTRLNEHAEMPRPTSTPAVRVNDSGVDAHDMSDRPKA